ncbi:hypothetical protein UR09_05490 [Candidatus Nitromaritima sp. SCGC AAA799-A02]|nr:hypothetical protein UZ36_07085 [Candidatus Nitromaritima sp. SCGC AAA799-C22]KMP10680.1 hypothetical protein UR09_05490 [Candidatus Nitromaritima sp. SCGC AAA799-A02]
MSLFGDQAGLFYRKFDPPQPGTRDGSFGGEYRFHILERGPMFYEVRILDHKGKIKKVLSSKSLSKRYWKSFFDNTGGAKALKKSKVKKEKNQGQSNKINYEDMYFFDS